MNISECIFCAIIAQQMPAAIIDQTDTVLVIKDIEPKAPTHYLIIPKKHVQDIQALQVDDASVVADMIKMAQKLSEKLPDSKAFRLIINSGADAGQCIFHLHMHFLAGKEMKDF